MKPKVYIETSVISYLTARPSRDRIVIGNQEATRQWWSRERSRYDLYISQYVLDEAAAGDPLAAAERLKMLADLEVLELTEEVEILAEALLNEGALPAKADIDAVHVAVAAIHGMNYLMTWNCKHMANAAMRPIIEETCRRLDIKPPSICTPQELVEVNDV